MSWLKKLTSGLSKSSKQLSEGISGIFTQRKLDDEMLEELEDLLIQADLGVSTAAEVTSALAKEKFDKEVSELEVKQALADTIAEKLQKVAKPLPETQSHTPYIFLMVGVNGNGKTTTIGKLAKRYSEQGKSIMLAACDTFRAAAVEQLQVWGERVGCEVITGPAHSDPASVAYQAVEKAITQGVDVLFIDTAGRLQTKSHLMDELAKIKRVIQKLDDSAPHQTVLVLDATTGQNAHSQVKAFEEASGVDGLIVTKLDGTAKGGVVVALAESFKKPILSIGVGEGIHDLQPFDANEFARSLMGITDEQAEAA